MTLLLILLQFAALMPLEPRLCKKLVAPLMNIIQTSNAMSLLYECIQTVITGGMIDIAGSGDVDSSSAESALISLCISKLKLFVQDNDQNCMIYFVL